MTLQGSPVPGWPPWSQFLVFFVLADLIQWTVHNMLHRVPVLWAFHKVHHSIHTMDFIGNFRFHWMEILVYKTAQWLPLVLLGASPGATFWVFVFTTFWGDLNHANLNVSLGPLGYVFNSPRMHLWHHDASDEGGTAKNLGIVLLVLGLPVWNRVLATGIGAPSGSATPMMSRCRRASSARSRGRSRAGGSERLTGEAP